LNFLTIEAEVVEQLGSLESVDPSVSAQVLEQGLRVLEGGETSAELEGAGMDAAALAGVCAAAGALLWCVESRDE